MQWLVLRLTLPEGGSHDYATILNSWTLPMVLKVNWALDLQKEANNKAADLSQVKTEGQDHGIW